MVAIVTGNGKGLERTSAFVLGSQGQVGDAALGRSGEGVYVNAATGNLLVTRQDEFLIGLGADVSAHLTYNSSSATDGDNNDGWRLSGHRTVLGPSGTYGATGTTVTRTDWDASATVYTWVADYNGAGLGAYVAKDGGGAYDTLTLDGTTWTWTDGTAGTREFYDKSQGGRIFRVADRDNNLVDYAYNATSGMLASITSSNGAGDDETVTFVYDTAVTTKLNEIVTTRTGAATHTRTHYAYETYDGSKTRLTSVTVDLSPNDNLTTDGNTYVTTYTYKDSSSALIASIGQTDGSRLDIEYDGSNRVLRYTQTVAAGVSRQTSFDYGIAGQTIVTDPAGQKTVMYYDGSKNLTAIGYPPQGPGATPRAVRFFYNGNGDVTRIVRGPEDIVDYDYDTHGNLTREQDSAGNLVERVYNARNELLIERRYAQSSTPQITRYAYDGEGHRRFMVSAEGFVTEHEYDSQGRLTATASYAGETYHPSPALGPSDAIDEGDVASFVAGLDKSGGTRVEMEYDFRGNLTRTFSYEALESSGSFDTGSQLTETHYVHDHSGNLLFRTVADPGGAETLTEAFVYDGLNRMTLATDFNGRKTSTTFLDNRGQTVVTHANGLSEISTYNRGGELIAFSTANAGGNLVDLAGWPADLANLPGTASVPGWINNAGQVAETVWAVTAGPDGRDVAVLHSGQADLDIFAGGNATNAVAIDGGEAYEFTFYFKFSALNKHNLHIGLSDSGTAYVENATTGADDTNPYFFQRGNWEQSPLFSAGKWYKVVGYVLPEGSANVDAGTLGGVYDVETGDKLANTNIYRWNAGRPNDNVVARFFNLNGEANQAYSTYFYQPEIRQVTVPAMPAAPDLRTTLYKYDGLGRLRMTTDPTGRTQHVVYDKVGRKIADIDGDGSMTEYRYDGNDNLTSTTRYAVKLDGTQLGLLTDAHGNPDEVDLEDIRPVPTATDDVWTFHIYDRAQRLTQTIDGTGATTVFEYDGRSQLISTRQYANRLSSGTINALKAAATTTNLWTNPDNGTLWTLTNTTASSVAAIDDYAAFQFTVTTSGQFQAVRGNAVAVVAGDTLTLTLTMMGVGSVTSNTFGLYGDVGAWGANGDSRAVVVSGPGTVAQSTGGLWNITGLSTTAATRVTITRTYASAANARAYLYVQDNGPLIVAGEATILSAPVMEKLQRTVLPGSDGTNDRVTRTFYDADGRLLGTLDAEGYLTRNVYDKAGRKIETIAYATATDTGDRASGTLADLLDGLADNDEDIHNYFLHDARGLLRATIDGEGNLTRMDYDELGALALVTTGQKLDPADLLTTRPTLANLPPAAGGTVLQVISYQRDAYGHVQTETRSTAGSGTTETTHEYDNMYRLVATTTQANGPDPRVARLRYDLRGNVIGTLNGIGSALLATLTAGSHTQADIDELWAEHGTTQAYDEADRLISSTDPNGNRSLFYYDSEGQLAYQIDALGETVRYSYDGLGRRTETYLYWARIGEEDLEAMTGGEITAAVLATMDGLDDSDYDSAAQIAYNVDGTVRQTTDPLEHVTTYAYNAFRELGAQVDPLIASTTRTTTLSYDRRGLLTTKVVDSAGVGAKQVTTGYGHDAFGRAVRLTDPGTYETVTTYDRAGRVTEVEDALNNETRYGYDARGNLVTVIDALSNKTRYVYDSGGRQIYAIEASGAVIKSEYDDDGRLLSTRAYANEISLDSLADEASASDVAGRISTDADDRITRHAYDKDGRLRFTLDATSSLVEIGYDDNGNAIRTIQYGGTIASTSGDYDSAYFDSRISAGNLLSHAATRVRRAVFDAADRQVYAIDANGSVTSFTHDSAGRVIAQRAFYTPFSGAFSPDLGEMDTWVSSHGHAQDRMSRAIYDQKGQLAYSVDAMGYVTRFTYNKQGSVTEQVRYADPLTVTDAMLAPEMDAELGTTPPGDAAVTSFAYDTAGRLIETTDPICTKTQLVLDQLGRATLTTHAAGTSDEAVVHRVYDALGRVTAETRGYGTSDASTVEYDYDTLGRLETVTDGRGSVTTMTYDAVGRMLTSRAQVDADPDHDIVTVYAYDAFDGTESVTVKLADEEALDTDTTTYARDKLGRLTSETNDATITTSYTYNLGGRTVTVTRAGATTTFGYDKEDNLWSVTDARGNAETYVVDAFGQRSSTTNRLGGYTAHFYDKLGRLGSEYIYRDAYNPDGTTEATQAGGYYQNYFVYDARGNLTWHTEAYGLGEQRVTGYLYDLADRRTQVTHEALVAVAADFTTSTVTPTETYEYDKRGNLILAIDTMGAKTFTYYDDLDRKTAQVVTTSLPSQSPAKGTLTHWTYDENGNLLTTSMFGDLVTVPASTAAAKPDPVDANKHRLATNAYDRANRLISTTISGLVTGAFDPSGSGTWSSTTSTVGVTYVHDKAGNVIRETDGLGSSVHAWYDGAGRKRAQVDKENYLTIWTHDAEGNVLTEIRYATRITGSFDADTSVDGLATLAGTNAADRATSFTYDLNGNRLTETRGGVANYSVNATTGALVDEGTDDATIIYTYNALNLVTSRTEANDDLTEFEYFNDGRQKWMKEATFTDHDGASVRRMTESFYDGLGNLVRSEVNKIGGSSGADRVTTWTYGTGGRLSAMTVAAGATEAFTRNYGYDAAGRVTRESYSRVKSDTTSVTEAIAYRYDLAGRLVTQAMASLSGSTWSFGDATRMRYNAYGELDGRGITASPNDTAVYQETFDYDAGGRLWRTNSGDGTVKIFLHDKAGNQTLVLSSTGADLSGYTQATAAAAITSAGGTSIGDAVTTIATFDKRGQQLASVERGRQLAWTGSAFTTDTITTSRAYNAFGEVTSETDARSNTTNFSYNAMGRLIRKESPSVNWTSESGAVMAARPTEDYYYDISGRMVGFADANGHQFGYVTTRLLLAGTGMAKDEEALVSAEFHTDGGVARNFYDVFGDLRIARNELYVTGDTTDFDEVYAYNKLGQLTSVQHRGNLLTDSYTYDGLGQRTRHWNSQLTSSVVERTDYDLQGRISQQVDMMGGITSFAYSWSGSIATTGLATFGGWTKETGNSAGETSYESLDYFGRTVARTDYGGHSYAYTFDLGGRLVSQTGGSGQSQVMSWLNTGRLYQVVDAAGTGKNAITARYGYDLAGNRVYEGYAGTVYSFKFPSSTTSATETLQNATIEYDALNRITSFVDKTAGGTTRITVTTSYDLAGNVRNVESVYPDLAAGSGTQGSDKWFRYDSMNRMVVADGTLNGSNEIVRGLWGYDVTWDKAGRRATQTKDAGLTGYSHVFIWNPDHGPGSNTPLEVPADNVNGHYGYVAASYSGERQEVYGYRADGALATVSFAETAYTDNENGSVTVDPEGDFGTADLRAHYERDGMGRITRYREYEHFKPDDPTVTTHDRYYVTYDARGNVLTETVAQLKRLSPGAYDTHVTVTDNDYTADGRLTLSTVDNSTNGSAFVTTTMAYTYAWWDGARIATTTYDKDADSGGNTPWVSTYAYDGLGRLASVKIDDDRDRTVSFAYAPEGQVLNRRERSAATGTPPATANPEDQRYFVAGRQVGELTSDGSGDPALADYATNLNSIRDWTANRQLTPFRWNHATGATQGSFGPTAGYEVINPFGQGAQSTSSTYAVREGETLHSIAAAAWGDASLWYLIAEANGLGAGSQLVAGQNLILPDRVTNARNGADTFKVYDPNAALGDLSPTSAKPPKKPGACAVVGQIIMVAIAIGVTIVTAGATAPLGPVLSGAVAGMAGSVASQAFGVATGLRKGFDFKGVAMGALGGAVGGALGPGGIFAKGAFGGVGPSAVQGAVRGIVSSALTQGIGVATGLHKSFSWLGVASAGLGGGTQSMLGEGMAGAVKAGRIGGTAAGMFASGASALANAGLGSLATGTSFGDNLIAALPDVIGGTIGNMVGNGLAKTNAPAATASATQSEESAPQATDGLNLRISGYYEGQFPGLYEPIPSDWWKNGWPALGILPREQVVAAQQTLRAGVDAERLRIASLSPDAGADLYRRMTGIDPHSSRAPSGTPAAPSDLAGLDFIEASGDIPRTHFGQGTGLPGKILDIVYWRDAKYRDDVPLFLRNYARGAGIPDDRPNDQADFVSRVMISQNDGGDYQFNKLIETLGIYGDDPFVQRIGRGLVAEAQRRWTTYGERAAQEVAFVDRVLVAVIAFQAFPAAVEASLALGASGLPGATPAGYGLFTLEANNTLGAIQAPFTGHDTTPLGWGIDLVPGVREGTGDRIVFGANVAALPFGLGYGLASTRRIGAPSIAAAETAEVPIATGFRGSRGFELVPTRYQPIRNVPGEVNGRAYSGHAFDQMQNRGIMPSVVGNTIENGVVFPTRAGTTGYYDAVNKVQVIVNSSTGRVVTVIRGRP